jgi:hypothetical protein
MKLLSRRIYIIAGMIVPFCSCSVIEKSSLHGFESDYYTFRSERMGKQEVYADLSDEEIDVYQVVDNQVGNKLLSIPYSGSESLSDNSIKFSEKSLDIDITTILFKYRPSVYDLPPQLNTDFNVALYAGWRHDNYHIKTRKDPLGNYNNRIINRGYDFGMFAGPGTTLVSPFTTRNTFNDEYNGFIFQFGLAGFLESNVASFGISAGFDYLLSPDRKVWIYNNKPWVGFIVGIALN